MFLLLFCLVRGADRLFGGSFGLLIHLLNVWRPRLYYHFFRSSSGEDEDLLPISKQRTLQNTQWSNGEEIDCTTKCVVEEQNSVSLCPACNNLTKNEQNKVQWKFVTRYIYCIVASANIFSFRVSVSVSVFRYHRFRKVH